MQLPQSAILDCRPSLHGKVAFLTGGFGGIGRAAIRALTAHGVRVACTYAAGREEPAQIEALLAEYPGMLSAHALELRSYASIQSAIQAAHEQWQRLDILVNNAAVGSATVNGYADTQPEQDSAMLAINADGALKVCQAFLQMIAPTRDQIPRKLINISSVGGGVQVFPGFRLSDGMSKAAVAFMTRQLAAELATTPIDVFALCPGATNTPMFQASTLNHLTPEQQAALTASLPKGRLIDPGEIANLIVFLASAYSTPLHGAVIDASMGLGVRPGLITEQSH
ncbi:MAG: SDR family oxidoreductase [Roseiflexaceae bacterium]